MTPPDEPLDADEPVIVDHTPADTHGRSELLDAFTAWQEAQFRELVTWLFCPPDPATPTDDRPS